MTAPCSFQRHRWGRWYPVLVTLRDQHNDPSGSFDTQERTCERCGRDQRKRWWRR